MRVGKVRYCLQCGAALESLFKAGKQRPGCPACGWVYFPDPKVAVAVVVEEDGRILFVERVMEPRQGYWTLPAGFVDAGEDPAQAAIREVKEETNLDIRDPDLLGILPVKEHADGADLLIVYRGILEGGTIQAGDDAARAAFFDPGDHPEYAFQSTALIIKDMT